jgi:hypothetical protein
MLEFIEEFVDRSSGLAPLPDILNHLSSIGYE